MSIDKLLEVEKPHDESNCTANIVFVHGLGGNYMDTWLNNGCYWPTLVRKAIPNASVWSLGYAVEPTEWKGRAMPLYDRAVNTANRLVTRIKNLAPLIFVCHSYGGLLVKEVLRLSVASGDARWKPIHEKTAGVCFLSTPHSGSNLANFFSFLEKHLGVLRLTGAFDELKKQNPNTRQLNEWFRNNCRSLGIEIDVYFEQNPTYGQLVVDADSANPNVEGITPVPVPEDHLSICKPAGPDEDIHVSLIAFIERTLKKN